MGPCVSCLRLFRDDLSVPNADFDGDQNSSAVDGKKGPIFVNSESPQDVTPLLNVPEVRAVVLSESSSGSFDQEVIDRLLKEVEDSEDSA